MRESLNQILEIQELDMQMLQLMRLKLARKEELDHIGSMKEQLRRKMKLQEGEILANKTQIRMIEGEVAEAEEKVKKLLDQQGQVKKVEEFNALSQETSRAEREKLAKEQKLSDLYDQVAAQEEELKSLEENYQSASESSQALEEEIVQEVERINTEGKEIQKKREDLVTKADSDLFAIYERLLRNKRDRVVVPIQDRVCSGCHIMVTAQHENVVRKGERLAFCEHCSRIHFWQEGTAPLAEEKEESKKRRRRRAVIT